MATTARAMRKVVGRMVKQMDAQEKRELVELTRSAAVALASLWDFLLCLEGRYNVSIDGTKDAVDFMASECGTPADSGEDLKNLTAKQILESFTIETVKGVN